jgi:hypothetical protein
MRNKRYVGVLAAAALALVAPNASAFSNVAVGDTGTATLSSATLSLGSFASCTGATMSLTATQDAGPAAGGAFTVPAATLSGCTWFGSAAPLTPDTTTPWTLSIDGSGAATLRGIVLNLNWGSLNCQYGGDVGGTYNQTTGNLVIAGTVTRRSGSTLCASPATLNGTFNVKNAAGAFVQL